MGSNSCSCCENCANGENGIGLTTNKSKKIVKQNLTYTDQLASVSIYSRKVTRFFYHHFFVATVEKDAFKRVYEWGTRCKNYQEER